MKFIKLVVLILIVINLVSCMTYQYATAKKESNEATQEQQQEVKTQVMKLLEEEYKQPFKLEDFSYKYERHWVDNSCQLSLCEMEKYGTYYFRVKPFDKSLTIEFKIEDDKKESTKDVIASFKKNQLNDVYCVGLAHIFLFKKDIKGMNIDKAKETCNARNQSYYKDYE